MPSDTELASRLPGTESAWGKRFATSRGFDGTAAAKTSGRKRAVTKTSDDFMMDDGDKKKIVRKLQDLHRGRGEALAEEAA